jgi:hypothetical protein
MMKKKSGSKIRLDPNNARKHSKKNCKVIPAESRKGGTINSIQAALMARRRKAERDIGAIPLPKNMARRKSCESDLIKFMETYLSASFYLPWSDDQIESINAIETNILHGGRSAIAAPRGDGKSTRVEAAAIWAISYGHRRFIVPILANHEMAEGFAQSLKSEFETNDLLAEDFPEICLPVIALEGIATRAHAQTSEGVRTQMCWKGKKLIFPSIKGSKTSGIIVQPKGLAEGIRGLKHKLATGEIIRPDFVVLDDPQDDEVANSPMQCDKRETLINKAVLGLAGPGKKISGFCLCTIIQKGDLADRILDRKRSPEWQGRCYKMIVSWPDALDTLWAQYNEVRNNGLRQDDGGQAGNEYYVKHRGKMDEGAKVSWEHRKEKTDISALQHAMNLYHRDKTSFASEYQNDPAEAKAALWDLKPFNVASRINHLKRYEVPSDANFLVTFADVNFIGLNYVTVAFRNDFSGHVIDYGKFPEGKGSLVDEKLSETATGAQLVAGGIVKFSEMIFRDKTYFQGSSRVFPQRVGIDGNFMTSTVHGAVKPLQRARYPVIVDRGRSIKQYRPAKKEKIIGTPGHYYHVQHGEYGQEIVHVADYWRMIAHKNLLLDVGVPGSLSLWGKDSKIHEVFAQEICSEKLVKYLPEENYWDWRTVPNQRNDKLDALVGCYVLGAVQGATLTGGEKAWRPKRTKRIERRKSRVKLDN